MTLMINYFVILMMINQLRSIKNFIILHSYIIFVINFLDQNLTLNIYIRNHNCQMFNHSTNLLKYLIFPTLTLFMTRPRHLFFTQNFLRFLTNDKFPLKILETIMIYNNYQKKVIVSSFHLPLRINNHFHKI